jgi:hypothetical protein
VGVELETGERVFSLDALAARCRLALPAGEAAAYAKAHGERLRGAVSAAGHGRVGRSRACTARHATPLLRPSQPRIPPLTRAPQEPVPPAMCRAPYTVPPGADRGVSPASSAGGGDPAAAAPPPPPPSARLLGLAGAAAAPEPAPPRADGASAGGLDDFWGALEGGLAPAAAAAAAAALSPSPRAPTSLALSPAGGASRGRRRADALSAPSSDAGGGGSGASSSSGEGPVVYRSAVRAGDWALVAPMLEEEAWDAAGRRARVMREGWVKDVLVDEPYQPDGAADERVELGCQLMGSWGSRAVGLHAAATTSSNAPAAAADSSNPPPPRQACSCC